MDILNPFLTMGPLLRGPLRLLGPAALPDVTTLGPKDIQQEHLLLSRKCVELVYTLISQMWLSSSFIQPWSCVIPCPPSFVLSVFAVKMKVKNDGPIDLALP